MSVGCFKKLSLVMASAVAVAVLTLVQPIADGEIDGLVTSNSSAGHVTDVTSRSPIN